MAATGLHISLAAEPVFQFGGITFTNSMFTSVVVSGLLILFAILAHSQLKNTKKPTGLQNIAEWIIESLYNLVHGITGDLKKTSLFFPFVATFFLFILLNNWFGLLPGVGTIMVPELEKKHTATVLTTPKNPVISQVLASETQEVVETEAAPHDQSAEPTTTIEEEHASEPAHPKLVPLFRAGTADLNMTIALALISMTLVQVFGLRFLSAAYLSKFFNFSSPIMFFVGILELFSEVGKILSFTFRLFGNVFAGEVLLAVIMSLVGVIVPMPFYGLEIFVGFIQALVFAMLSLVFFNMATLGHSEHD